jgi:hypothetical protein
VEAMATVIPGNQVCCMSCWLHVAKHGLQVVHRVRPKGALKAQALHPTES